MLKIGVVRDVSHILLGGVGAGSGTERGSMMFGSASTKEVAWLMAKGVSAEEEDGAIAVAESPSSDGVFELVKLPSGVVVYQNLNLSGVSARDLAFQQSIGKSKCPLLLSTKS